MSQRTSVFADPRPGATLDVSDFSPATGSRRRPPSEEIDASSPESRFKSREPMSLAVVDESLSKRKPMVYRTGRNVVFSAKTTRQTVEQFYALAEANGWKANETFEKAVAALQRECNAST